MFGTNSLFKFDACTTILTDGAYMCMDIYGYMDVR